MRLLTPIFLVLTLALGGCDYLAQKELKPGISTLSEVREYMGMPETIWEEPDGTQIHEYPMGLDTYMIVIEKSGVFQSMTNVLVPAQFAKITPGTDKGAVRRLLGRPTDVEFFKRKQELVWTYRHAGKIDGKEFFVVYFDQADKVTRTEIMQDYDPGGN
jgi:hypothetical protein